MLLYAVVEGLVFFTEVKLATQISQNTNNNTNVLLNQLIQVIENTKNK